MSKNPTRYAMLLLLLFLYMAKGNFLIAQKLVYQAGMSTFFENLEFSKSQIRNSQTMAGVHLIPAIGMQWNDQHYIYAGIDLMHEFGSYKMIDNAQLLAYYQYAGEPFRFYMGAFPRHETLKNYPKMFFMDSVNNYRPTINGLFWELSSSKKDSYINVWLDWTSRQTETHRETFFMGWSGRYQWDCLYAQHFGYMYHYAGMSNPTVPQVVYDNGLILTSLGLDFAAKTKFDKLELNAGWAVGLERNRSIGQWYTPQGFYSELMIEYLGLGVKNTLYYGHGQQLFYESANANLLQGNHVYWGDPIFRVAKSNQTQLYVNFYKSKTVNVCLSYGLIWAESNLYHEQKLTASVYLGSQNKERHTSHDFIWNRWFVN